MSSSVMFGPVVAAIVVSTLGCQVQASVKTKVRYQEPNIVKEDTAPWDGQSITIKIEGVGISYNGGVTVTADPNATKVTAAARMLATAFEDEKANADLSIAEAKNTFTVSSSSAGITVSCGHGGTHGSSNGGESGCELVEVTIPTGSAQKPMALTILGGNGDMTLQLSAATVTNIGVNSGGSLINAALPATKGANISVVAEQAGDIAATMPADWAADEVLLQADPESIVNSTDAKIGAGAGGRGAAGTGLASLKITSKDFAGSTGTITLR